MNRPTLMILVGIPGSGKSTYADTYCARYKKEDIIHCSSDAIREELYGDASNQADPSRVFQIMQDRALDALSKGISVVYDATNITRNDRSKILDHCPKGVVKEARIIWCPIDECIKRDAARDRTVGKAVIDKILKRFQVPYYDEGFDNIKIVRNLEYDSAKYTLAVNKATRIPHDNPHHTLGVLEHCEAASEYIISKKPEINPDDYDLLLFSAYWHDVGKPYVKSFANIKDKPTTEAHYYNHQNVGAWIALGLPDCSISRAWLVNAHMDPFLNTSYYHKLPEYLKNTVDLLHEADLAAH